MTAWKSRLTALDKATLNTGWRPERRSTWTSTPSCTGDKIRHSKSTTYQADPNAPAQCLSLIHISEPTRLLSISYAVFCLNKKTPEHLVCRLLIHKKKKKKNPKSFTS